MLNFLKKKNENLSISDYEKFSKKLIDINNEILLVKKELEIQKTLINSINGRINKKLNPDLEESQEKDIKAGFPYNLGGGGLS